MKRIGWALALWLSAAVSAAAAEAAPACGSNAALRYWMAFALMVNPPSDPELAARLGSVADGKEPWHESLAPVVEQNQQALATMHRGTRLPFCDWGWEHELHYQAPVANVLRAASLARLNVLHGMHRWRQGRRPEAIDAWRAGLRFSRDVAADGPILAALTASLSLRQHLGALAVAAGEKGLDPASRTRVEQAVAALPEDGIDWGVAVRGESEANSMVLASLERSDDPLEKLREWVGGEDRRLPDIGLSQAQLSDIEAVRAAVRRARALNDELRPRQIAAFQAPYHGSEPLVREVDARARQDSILTHFWPSHERLNQRRGEVVRARAELLALLRAR